MGAEKPWRFLCNVLEGAIDQDIVVGVGVFLECIEWSGVYGLSNW